MKIRLLLLCTILALVATVAFAADISGKWTAETTTQRGTQTTTFDFKVDGNKLTGTVGGGRGNPVEIADGKIDGDNVSFTVTRTMGGGGQSFKQTYTGKVSGNEIKFTVTTEGREGSREMTAKKATT